jgi:hypothetical protein
VLKTVTLFYIHCDTGSLVLIVFGLCQRAAKKIVQLSTLKGPQVVEQLDIIEKTFYNSLSSN